MNWVKRHDLTVFLVIAFALSWLAWPLVLMNPESSPLLPFGPIIGAFIILALTRGWAGVRELLMSMVRWRVGLRWYAVALLLPAGITLVALYLNAMLGGSTPMAADFAGWYSLPVLFLSTTLVGGPLFEEPGWRGFALPRLQSKYTPLVASLIIGVIWASWHLPELISEPSGQRPPVQFVVAVVAQSVVYAWLYNGTNGSVLLTLLIHGVDNTIFRFLAPIALGGAAFGQFWWFRAVLWCAAAVAVIAVFGMARDRAPSIEAPETAATSRVR
jgi:membrane protease YdiL (CAAX protease family)